jgi:hypothetical protein
MRFLWISAVIIVSGAVFGCMSSLSLAGAARYTVTLHYSSDRLSGKAFAGQSILILPVLTRDGPDTARFPSPSAIARFLQENRHDLQFVYPAAFEKKYRLTTSGRDTAAMDRFYRSLYNGEMMAVQTSDSIWKAVDAAYLLSLRVTYAAAIRGFDGTVSKRLTMEAELWEVAASEAVWRSEVVGVERNAGPDNRFILGAIKKVLGAIPGFLPATNEKDW